MRTATRRALILSLMLAASPAGAQTISEDGAKELAAAFATYVGQPAIDQKIVSVAPGTDAYTVTIDLPKIVAGMTPADGKVDVSVQPFAFEAAPKDDGTWTVTADSFPAFKLVQHKEGGEETVEIAAENYHFEGTFDAKLAAFTSGEGKVDKVTFASHSPEGDAQGEQGATTMTLEGASAADGAVTAKIHQVSAGFAETVTIKSGEAPVTVTIKTGEVALDMDIDSARQKSLLEILAFFAANPGKDKAAAAQADLKARLLAALPLWNGIGGTISFKDVAVETPMGAFKAAAFTETLGLSGASKDAYYDLGIKVDGLQLPEGLVPAWAKPALPSALDVSMRLSGPDLEAVSRLAVDKLDVGGKEPWPKDVQDQLAGYFVNGPLKLTLKPGGVTAPSLTLALEGGATILPQPPEVSATVTADGLDKTMADLQTSTDQDPNKQQALMMLGMAKALAKPGDGGKALWKIEMAKDGSVSVNGQQLQPPTQQQQ